MGHPKQAVAQVFPPGDFIREELEARGWTQAQLAEILGRPLQLVNAIVNAKKEITPATAIALGTAFETGPEFWLNLEERLSAVPGRPGRPGHHVASQESAGRGHDVEAHEAQPKTAARRAEPDGDAKAKAGRAQEIGESVGGDAGGRGPCCRRFDPPSSSQAGVIRLGLGCGFGHTSCIAAGSMKSCALRHGRNRCYWHPVEHCD